MRISDWSSDVCSSDLLPAECPRWPVSPELDPVVVIPLAEFTGVVPLPDPTPSDVKVSAAWLIEHAGLGKGFALPRSRAGLSTKHTLALTNRGGATAAEIAELARFVQQLLPAEFGLILHPEPVLLGVELRSDEHTYELQSHMRTSYSALCFHK